MNDHNLQFANTVGLRRKMYALGRTVENNAPMIHFYTPLNRLRAT